MVGAQGDLHSHRGPDSLDVFARDLNALSVGTPLAVVPSWRWNNCGRRSTFSHFSLTLSTRALARFGIDRLVKVLVGIGVDFDLVTHFVREDLVGWHAQRLAGDVEQGHVDSAEAATGAAVQGTISPDHALISREDCLDVQGVLADQQGLRTSAVFSEPASYLAQTVDVLVGVDLDAVVVVGGDRTAADVGDLQVRRPTPCLED